MISFPSPYEKMKEKENETKIVLWFFFWGAGAGEGGGGGGGLWGQGELLYFSDCQTVNAGNMLVQIQNKKTFNDSEE